MANFGPQTPKPWFTANPDLLRVLAFPKPTVNQGFTVLGALKSYKRGYSYNRCNYFQVTSTPQLYDEVYILNFKSFVKYSIKGSRNWFYILHIWQKPYRRVANHLIIISNFHENVLPCCLNSVSCMIWPLTQYRESNILISVLWTLIIILILHV